MCAGTKQFSTFIFLPKWLSQFINVFCYGNWNIQKKKGEYMPTPYIYYSQCVGRIQSATWKNCAVYSLSLSLSFCCCFTFLELYQQQTTTTTTLFAIKQRKYWFVYVELICPEWRCSCCWVVQLSAHFQIPIRFMAKCKMFIRLFGIVKV